MLKLGKGYLCENNQTNYMKQVTFSNVIAIGAILLCFYSFVGEKQTSQTADEKEYCIMKFYPSGYLKSLVGANLMFSDGRFEHDATILSDDPTSLKTINVQIKKLTADGWNLKQHSQLSGSIGVDQFIFERTK